ncbi:MAG: putative Vacuolar protein sorting-associated protein 4 [Streblomastix strix]|uniref:Putative Vacuolar protein sorting-associated protein 4 n=1 Tax=Streblomastix strix TaxID=222440 RepID=A0A5J4X8V9_9EUKA|nr:MAG: putative Vacuolar protein sorting-associated protein 4 [Streblomastix strix]
MNTSDENKAQTKIKQGEEFEKQNKLKEARDSIIEGLNILMNVRAQSQNQDQHNRITQLLKELVVKIDKIDGKIKQAGIKIDNDKKKTGSTGNADDDKKKDDLDKSILSEKPNVKWSDIAGLDDAKQFLQEAVSLPKKHPELFVGERKPWKSILMFGPPGTGKSFLAKAVATEVDAKFFTISSAEINSKWVGEGEKNVRELFEKARNQEQSVIFIDEIDSITAKRGDETESESARRIKTELFIQMQGVGSKNDNILLLAATNTPWNIDSAALRRFNKRVYIPLPDTQTREKLFRLKFGKAQTNLNNEDYHKLGELSEGRSGSDITNIVRDALYQPIRDVERATHFKQISVPVQNSSSTQIASQTPQQTVKLWAASNSNDKDAVAMTLDQIPANEIYKSPVTFAHVLASLQKTKGSVMPEDVRHCIQWNEEYGTTI